MTSFDEAWEKVNPKLDLNVEATRASGVKKASRRRSIFGNAKILYVDIETSPHLADVWGLWDQNVPLARLRKSGRIIGFGYQWLGERRATWVSEFDGEAVTDEAHREMLQKAWDLYDEADVVVTYNGDKFDHLHFNAEWVSAEMTPPAPAKSIDLYRAVKKNFKFPSNKLEYVSQRLLGDSKVKHAGYQMWRDCLDDDVDPAVKAKAWRDMGRYCRQDVQLMLPLHERLLPWLPANTNLATITGMREKLACPKCASEKLERRGFAYTATRAYQRYCCKGCGGWSRSGKHEPARAS